MVDLSGKFHADNYIYPELQFICLVGMITVGTYECGGALSIDAVLCCRDDIIEINHTQPLPAAPPKVPVWNGNYLLGRCLCMPMFLKTTPPWS